jgi:hypothetical protein
MIGRGHRGRVDANHTEIVKALRQMGCSVQSLAIIGHGCPDLLVGVRGVRNVLMEIKDGTKVKSSRKLTDAEQKWHDSWHGDVVVVNSVEEAVRIIEAL